MPNNKAIPPGYMTVGELAKKAGATVCALQYYDKEGLLSPSTKSEGGRRLYTDKDMVKLHQIQSLKYLGFSLDEIKGMPTALDTPADVEAALTGQATAIREKIAALTEALTAIEALKAEVLQMQSVDFKKYADIIVNLQMKNDMYWLIKHFDDETLDQIRKRFDKESGQAFMTKFQNLYGMASQYQKDNVAPEGPVGQAFAKEFWEMLMEFTSGDMSLLPKLIELANPADDLGKEWANTQESANRFIEATLDTYLTALGYHSLEGLTK